MSVIKTLKKLLSVVLCAAIISGVVAVLPAVDGSADPGVTAAAADSTSAATGITYGSNGTITRAEWLHNLAIVFDMSVDSDAVPDNYFSDLESSHPYYNDILLTVEFGVVNIEAGGNILANELVTRDFAVSTLNFCLGYQEKEDDVYPFSDYELCSSPIDALVAVERGWLVLIDNKFMPELSITSTEAETMLNDASSILSAADIDPDYESKYVLKDDVIVVPEWVNTFDNGQTISIENSPVSISTGNRFAVYENSIPTVYEAGSVEVVGNTTIITVQDSGIDDAYKVIDAQGEIGSGDMDFIAAEGVDLEVDDIESEAPLEKSSGLRAVRSEKKLKKNLKASTELTLAPGVTASVSIKIKDPVVEYNISSSYSYVTLNGESEISYALKGDLPDSLGSKSLTIITCPIGGIGSFDVTVELGFSGKASGTVKGYLSAGIECSNGGRIRPVHVFQQKEYYTTVEAEAKIGLKASLGVTHLPFVKAYIYAEIGAKAKLKVTSYNTAPYRCTHFAAHLYFEFGAQASVDFGGWKTSAKYSVDVIDENNSPIRVVHHYEDGVEVPSCTRGTSYNNYFTKWNSRYYGSGWSGASGAYGLDNAGNSVPLYTYSVNDGKATITKYNGNSYSVAIPETIDGYTVIAIGNSAFNGKNVRYVSIPDSVTTIGYNAFANNSALEKITLPDTVTTIEGKTFSNCISLNSIEWPKNIKTVGNRAFENCTSIERVEIPKTLEAAGADSFNSAFYGCSSLKEVTFENGTTKILTGILGYCNALEKITLPDTVTTIEGKAFSNCIGLNSIEWPKNIKTVGNRAFENCDAIKRVFIPKTIKEAGANAFNSVFFECSRLKDVTFEDGITKVMSGLFGYCDGLESICIPENFVEIEYDAFSHCASLKTVTMCNNITEIGYYAFSGCTSLESIVLSENVTEIKGETFKDCRTLKSITIPPKIMKIGDTAFKGCTNLKDVDFASGSCINEIGYESFNNCTSLKTIELPSTVTTIRNNAFNGCTSLESFTFENGKSSLKEIQSNAFYGCTSLKEAILPETVSSIGNAAFQNCVSLEKLYIPESTKTLEANAFLGDEMLKDVTISDYSITKINNNTFKDCSALASVVLPKGLTTIGSQAFMNDTVLFDVTIPESVKTINSNAFSYPAKTTIHGKAGSYAETFANNNGFKFHNIAIAAEGISLIDGIENITLDVGETYRAQFEFYPEEANDVIVITSNNTRVSINGHDIKANSAGDSVLTASSSSGVTYDFNVHIRSVSKIAIKSPANKLTYNIGEDFDRTGLVAEITYNDKTTREVTDYTISGFDSSAEGSCTVTLSWVAANGYTYKTTFSVVIVDPAPKLTGISIKQLPDKLVYERKESLDLTGLVVMADYSDNSSKAITDYTVSGYNALKYGVQTITVTYQEKTASFTVTVKCTDYLFGEWTTVVDPTCKDPGKKTRTCSKCGYVEEEVIPALGHDYHSTVVPPTHTEQGYTLHTCSRCGDSFKDNFTDLTILTNISTVSSETIVLGKKLTITGAAEKGTAPYTYAYYYKRSSNSKWNVIGTEFSSATTATFKPASAADYDIKVIVRDAKGDTAEKTFRITVVPALTNNSWINAEKVQIGDDIRVTGGAEGGAGGYTYAFYFKRSANSKWNKIGTEFGTKTYGITVPKAAADYDMKVIVKDSAGTTAEKIFTVTVVESLPLTNISYLNAYDVPVGKTVTAAGRFVGGARPCTYEFYFKRTANTKWNKLSYGNEAGTYAKFTPTSAASYDIKVVAIDSAGTMAEKIMTITAS